MEADSLPSQSDGLSGDDSFVPRLLFPSKEKKDVAQAGGVLSEDKKPSTRKRKAPASTGKGPSTAKRPRTRNNTSAVVPLASHGSQLSCSPGGVERWIDAIIPREGSEDEEVGSYNEELSSDDEERPVDLLLRRTHRICRDSAKLDLAAGTDRAEMFQNFRVGLAVVMVMCAHPERRSSRIDVKLHSILDSVTTMINELQKPVGADAVTAASKDMQARYAGKDGQPGRYSNKVIIYCLRKFVENHLTAVIWNVLPGHLKDIRMRDWARELDDDSKTVGQEE